MTKNTSTDVSIIGSGIAGLSLACILAKNGLDVTIFEGSSHPKFSIGESMILETSELMRSLCHYYDIPELGYFSSIKTAKYAINTNGIKKHFGFIRHEQNKESGDDDVLQAIIPDKPYGHEIHIYRQDSDYLLLQAAIKYGAQIHQKTLVEDIDLQEDQVILRTTQGAFTAKFIVDGGSFRSLLRKKLDIESKEMRTQTRAMFTHMMDVGEVENTMNLQTKLPWKMNEGTLHHVFDGGWCWVIPFNNHTESRNNLVSVGVMLDPNKYVFDDDVTPMEEFNTLLTKFPSIGQQFSNYKPVMPWVRTPSAVQFKSTKSMGDRWALLGTATGFIDPLYSKGIYHSMISVSILAEHILCAHENNTNLTKYADSYTSTMRNFVESNDALIYYSYKSFENPKMYRLYSVIWLVGAYNEYLKLTTNRAFSNNHYEYNRRLKNLRMVGGGFAAFDTLESSIHSILDQFVSGKKSEKEINELYQLGSKIIKNTYWIPDVFKDILNGKTYLPKRKIRTDLFERNSGFMKTGEYKDHFFEDKELADVIKFFAKEIWIAHYF